MSWFSRLFPPSRSKSTAGHATTASPRPAPVATRNTWTPSFAVWADPPSPSPSSEWERRLHKFAHKCSLQLKGAAIPPFRSEWPRSGVGTYVDAFWLVAVDVEHATRSWRQNNIHVDRHSQGKGYPPGPVQGDYTGHFNGQALLLTTSGLLCTTKVDGFLTRNGGLSDRKMDISFQDLEVDLRKLQTLDWGWGNSGRWRRYPNDDLKVYGLQVAAHSIRFTDRWRPGTNQNTDGKGTSAALSKFVRSAGSTNWPRNFASFDYD